jgi:MFS family permease
MKERPIYNAAIGLCWGTGCILGPVIGGGFAESSATWRWAFYINLPLAALVAPVYFFLFPKYTGKPDLSGPTKLRQIDWVGVFLNAGVWTLFQVACTFSGSTWKWKSAGPIALWVVFGVFLFCYVIQQIFCVFTTFERRLFPVQILKSRTIVLLYFAHAAAAATVFVAVYYIPLFFQFTRGDSAIKAAVRLLPFICIMIFFVMFAGGILPVLGRYMPLYVIGGIFMTIGGALMHTVDAGTSTSAIYGYEVLVAIGAGIPLQVAYSVAVVKVKPEEIQGAIGVMNVAQIGSTAIALSLANIIFQNVGFIKLRDTLAGRGFSAEDLRGALAGAKSTILAGDDPNVQKLAIDAIVDTMGVIWILVIVAGAVSIVSGIFMKREKLSLQ